MDVIGFGCNCLHGLYWFKFTEHEFREARSASFRIFQLVFGCVCVCLACMSRVQISCDLEFFFFLVDCMAA